MNAEPMRTIQCLSCGTTWRAFERNGIWHGAHPINACPGRGTHVSDECAERYGVVHSPVWMNGQRCSLAPKTWEEWTDRAVSVLMDGLLSDVEAEIHAETQRIVDWWRAGPHEPPAGAQVLPHGDWLLPEPMTCTCPCGCEHPQDQGKQTCWSCWASVKRHEERLRRSGKGIVGALSAHVAEQQKRKVRVGQ